MSFFASNPETVKFTVDGKEWKLAFDMEAVAAFEDVTGQSFFDGVDHVGDVQRDVVRPRMKMLGHFLAAGLRREHGVVPLDEAMRLAIPALPAIIAALIEAIPAVKEGEEENPPTPAGDANAGNSTN